MKYWNVLSGFRLRIDHSTEAKPVENQLQDAADEIRGWLDHHGAVTVVWDANLDPYSGPDLHVHRFSNGKKQSEILALLYNTFFGERSHD